MTGAVPAVAPRIPVTSELKLYTIWLADERGVDTENEASRAGVAVAAFDRPNTIGRKPRSSPMLAEFRCRKRWINPRDPGRLKSPSLLGKVACYDDVLGRYVEIAEPIAAAAIGQVIHIEIGSIELEYRRLCIGCKGEGVMSTFWNPPFRGDLANRNADR